MRAVAVVLVIFFLFPLEAVAAKEYVIQAGDILDIAVAGEPDLTQKTTVRSDGRVTLGLVGDIKAEGLTPEQFRAKAEKTLRKYIKHPKVTVGVTGYDTAACVNVLGAVNQPGHYPLVRKTTLMDALGLAGGTTDKAKLGEITIIHNTKAGDQKTRVDLAKMVKTGDTRSNLVVQPGDTIYVPRKKDLPAWLKLFGLAASVGYSATK